MLDDIVNKYNNTVHRTIKMKPIDVKDNTCIDSNKEVNDKDPKFTGGDHVRIYNVKVDLSNYAAKTDLKNVTHVDISSFALKTNLATLKTEVDKLETDKLKTVPVDLSKLSNAVKNEVVKKLCMIN